MASGERSDHLVPTTRMKPGSMAEQDRRIFPGPFPRRKICPVNDNSVLSGHWINCSSQAGDSCSNNGFTCIFCSFAFWGTTRILLFPWHIADGKKAARLRDEWNGIIERSLEMLYWSLIFLLIAILAAVFGFTGISILAAGVAKVLFFVFLVLFVISLVAHVSRRV